jgi:hypothetical protein
MNDNLNRRDVLKAAGVTGSIVLASNVQATDTGYGPVRFVEVGVEYDVESRGTYHTSNVDGNPGYFVDSQREAVVLYTPVLEDVARPFEARDTVIGALDVASAPTRVTRPGPVREIATGVVQRRRPVEHLHLTEPHQPPDVHVREAGGELLLVAEGDQVAISPDTETAVELAPRTVAARTFTVTDQTVEIEAVPEHRWGPRAEYGSVEVEAVPTVTVRDHGELSVERIDRR